MLLGSISVQEVIVAFMAIAGVVTVIIRVVDHFTRGSKRIQEVEYRLLSIEKKLTHNDLESKLVIKALLALLEDDSKHRDKIREELQEFLVSK